MSYVSKVEQIYANEILLTSKSGTNVNISCSTGEVLINGADPSGGGASLPLIGTGNIEIDGLFESTGNITTTAGNIVATTGNVELTAGDVELTTGDIKVNGTGNIKVEGTGNISVSTGGITSVGDIQTSTGDIVSAGDFIFEGDDIKRKTYDPVAFTSYVQYKQLPQLNANNTFTGANKFNDNVTEFAEKVSVGTRDAQGLFTQTIALNKSGNIESQTIQNVTSIQTGTLNCGNGGTNSCAARTFTTRTSGLAGWKMEQVVPSVPPSSFDNILNFRAGQAGGYVTITDSVGSFVPNIILDPKTPAIGGLIKTTTFEVGDGGLAYKLTQPNTGPDTDNLLIKSNSAVSECIFQDETSATIMNVKKSEVQLGNTLPLLFGAYSFRPIQYRYSKTITIRDTQDTTNYTNMVFNCLGTASQPTLGGKNVWTRVNDGVTNISLYNAALEGFYKCSITQTGDSSSANFRGTHIIFDYILKASIQDTPDLTPPISYGYNTFPADRTGPPALSTVASVLIDHRQQLSSQSQPVFLNFSDPPVVGETMPILVSLTKLDF